MNNSYIHLVPFFNTPSERNISFLAEHYTNNQHLEEIIGSMIANAGLKIGTEDTVLLKPNLVLHPQNDNDIIALNTHPSIIISVLKNIIQNRPKKIIIGDAPIQGCSWKEVLPLKLTDEIQKLSQKFSVPVIIIDFRKVNWENKEILIQTEGRAEVDYLIFDLGKNSFLEPITDENVKFRVTDYDPERMIQSHKPGMHKYCIIKELFEATKIITLPKVKTHQKTGITAALKILVGINGDKDFLPHHRKGGSLNGGDCYPGRNGLMKITEDLLDHANKYRGKFKYKVLKNLSRLTWKTASTTPYHNLQAAWYGNDTCWRMVLDLNKIARYGTYKGEIASIPQREIYSISDGIIGGQGNGPLHPEPLPMGFLSISNNSNLTDKVFARLMGFNFEKIPLIMKDEVWTSKNHKIFIKGKEYLFKELTEWALETKPPPGWENNIEL